MKILNAIIIFSLAFISPVLTSHAAAFKQSKVTQVVNDVEIISGADQTEKPAVVDDIFTMPDILRTGPASRAELVAPDDTVTRVGANTIFTFDPASRTIDLKQGSLLFHSPHGQGGGTIQTGSASASVLGSTLIVTTTPNGGFKVIALEDDVHIKLHNGLQQFLKPGEMTYILPGGEHLAPIVIFRLDDLIMNSLLVKGFNDPLSSLPLILREIHQQDHWIKSGRFTDTGLLAGDNANANQVQVLDDNTVDYADNPQGVARALRAAATINQPSLTDASIPVPPSRIFFSTPIALFDNSFFSGQAFEGFAASDIYLNPGIDSAPLTVDLSPYASEPEFDFVAVQNIDIENSLTFAGLSAANQLALIGGGQITIAPNITLQANAGDFEIATPGALTLDSVIIDNADGNVGLTSGSTINLENNFTIKNAGQITVTAANAFNFTSVNDVNVGTGDPGGAPGGLKSPTTISAGQVTLTSTSHDVTVENTSIQTQYLTVNSGDSILLDASGQSLTTTGTGATAQFTAGFNHNNSITVQNTDLSAFAIVNMSAYTINLKNVAFAGTVNLKCANGVWNNGTIVYGDVNNLGGNTDQGILITAPTGTTGTLPGTSVTVSALP